VYHHEEDEPLLGQILKDSFGEDSHLESILAFDRLGK
jgi:hypothetical protein